MRSRFSWFFSGVAIVLAIACKPAKHEPVKGNYAIFPLPVAMDSQAGYFIVDEQAWIQSDSFPDAGFDPLKVFHEVFMRKSGYALPAVTGSTGEGASDHLILILRSPVITNPEGYRLRVTPFGIIINAGTTQGVFYAFQTLRQLMRLDALPDLRQGRRTWAVPHVDIQDEPAFAYRGLHLDVSRHLMPLTYVKRYIEQLAYYKMNRFHWHLTDDQGWRIEIPGFPKLQEVAAWREATRSGHYSDVPIAYDSTRYGGYYTREEIREVVAYAADRGVTVIPEIEMPGHAMAALTAYPALGCTGGPYSVATTWGVFDDVFCPKEETFTFLEGVLREVVDMFPSTYVHIGGDECPKTRWKTCAHCQALMQKEGLSDEHVLQSYFIRRIASFLERQGRRIIGWDEILEGGLAPDATVMSWRGTQGGIAAARAGHDVIMTPGTPCYFDHYQADPENEPLAIGGLNTLQEVYAFNPVPDVLTPDEAKHILGAQGNLWTEYIPDPDKADYMAYPRAIALAEVLWTPASRRRWSDFTFRLDQHRDRMDGLGIRAANHLRTPSASLVPVDSGLQIILTTPLEHQTIFYSEDTLADVWGNMMSGDTLVMRKPATLYYKSEDQKVRSITYKPSLSAAANLSATPAPSVYYPGAAGLLTLADGLIGNRYHNGRDWCAWDSTPVEIVLYWPAPVRIDTVALGLLSGPGAWIHYPESVIVEGSTDNRLFSRLATWAPEGLPPGRTDARIPCPPGSYRAIRLQVRPLQQISSGLPGAGHAAWTFIDEIDVH